MPGQLSLFKLKRMSHMLGQRPIPLFYQLGMGSYMTIGIRTQELCTEAANWTTCFCYNLRYITYCCTRWHLFHSWFERVLVVDSDGLLLIGSRPIRWILFIRQYLITTTCIIGQGSFLSISQRLDSWFGFGGLALLCRCRFLGIVLPSHICLIDSILL